MSEFPWNMQGEDTLRLEPGVYAVEVTKCESKQSNAGNPMWVVSLKATDFNTKLCDDYWTLTPKAINICKAKMSALGFAVKERVESGHLLGRRCWVTVKAEPYKDKNGSDRTALRVDIDAKGSQCGYWKEKPGDVREPVEAPF